MLANQGPNNGGGDDVIMLEAPVTDDLIIVDDSDDGSLRQRSVSVEYASDSDSSIMHDIQDVLDDEDDDVVMLEQHERPTIDLT